jgi:uncharacterized protein YndB with AHSA1/START domain
MADDTVKDRPSFVYVTYIRSTREKVFAALTDGDATRAFWFGYRIESDWKVGGPLRFYNPEDQLAHDDTLLTYDPPSTLAYSWKPLMKGYEDETESRVTFTLEQTGDQVKLTMVHDEMMPGGKMLNAVSTGWPAVIASLKSLLETGAALDRPVPRPE